MTLHTKRGAYEKAVKDAIKRLEARIQEWGRYTYTMQFAEFVMDVHTVVKHVKEGAKK